jgi:hypothetical protein
VTATGVSHGDLVGVRSSDQRRPGQRCAHTKLFLPSMCTHQAFLAIDVHTPSFSCHRCAHNRASSSSPHGRDPVGCSSSDQRRPGQQQQSPREWTRLDVPRVIIAEPGQQQSPREGTWLEFPRWSANRSSPTGPAMCTHQAFLASDVHTPSFSCHRCAHNRASSSSPQGRDPVGCSLDGRQIDHRRAGPCLQTLDESL